MTLSVIIWHFSVTFNIWVSALNQCPTRKIDMPLSQDTRVM